MTNELDTIPPTPVYGFDKIQVQNMGWVSTIGDVVNADLQKIETAIQSGSGGTTDYTQLTNKPSINNVTLTGNQTASELNLIGTTGGNLTGTIVDKTGLTYAAILKDTNDSNVIISGGTDATGTDGAYVLLSGQNSSMSGGFELSTYGGKKLVGMSNETLTWAGKNIVTEDSAVTLTNKTISTSNNSITGIAGTNFATQLTTEAGKAWGINDSGATTLITVPAQMHVHYIHLVSSKYHLTCTVTTQSSTAFTASTFQTYLHDNGLTGSTFNDACLPASGVAVSSVGYLVYGISSTDGSSITVFRADNSGDISVESDSITTIVDTVV